MTYPPDFPEDCRNEVETAITVAEQALTDCEQNGQDVEVCVMEYVKRVFVDYCYVICRAVQEGKWTADKARTEMARQLKQLIADTCYEKLGSVTSTYLDERLRETRQAIAQDWKSIQAHLRNAIEAQEQRKRAKSSPFGFGLGQIPSIGELVIEALSQPKEVPIPTTKIKNSRQFREPKPELLKNPDATLNRITAAEAVGASQRTFDRWVEDGLITPIYIGARKRFKIKDLIKFMTEKTRAKSRQ